MENPKCELRYYRSPSGKTVVAEWLTSLPDRNTRAKIRIRLDRLEEGNAGDHRAVGEGVLELRIHFGPGYRIYVGRDGSKLIILLCGGDKSTQTRDVRQARQYWREYRSGGKG